MQRLLICLVLAAGGQLAAPAGAVTLREATLDEDALKRFVHYDTAEFNQWFHLAIALPVMYSILFCIWATVTCVMKVTGRSRKTRD
ncbi:hypothetical protein BOX15_Mlig026675g1 [Macrostomum lignano]|uniref:Uncharacterized protein n=1 Tax=Macrostomum lignano TaxID=282301 RepID=A0A267DVV6_9PLAT|nr:hypothetical protein BOX15_Mlig026675g1 [Macrostomum lignano]